MSIRYTRWDGSQELPPFDADDVLEALADDLLAEGDVRRALQRLMQRGMRGHARRRRAGAARIVERLRAPAARGAGAQPARRRAGRGRRAAGGDRDAGARRASSAASREAERRPSTPHPDPSRTQRGWRSRCCAAPPSTVATASTRCPTTWPAGSTGLRDYEFMDAAARDAFNALTDELRQQMLQTYFQG